MRYWYSAHPGAWTWAIVNAVPDVYRSVLAQGALLTGGLAASAVLGSLLLPLAGVLLLLGLEPVPEHPRVPNLLGFAIGALCWGGGGLLARALNRSSQPRAR